MKQSKEILLGDSAETRVNKLPEEQRRKKHPLRTVFTGRDRKTEEVVVVAMVTLVVRPASGGTRSFAYLFDRLAL